MERIFSIYHARNGYIITSPEEGADGNSVEHTDVYPVDLSISPTESELEQLRSMLYEITDRLGYFGSKHHKYRLVISVVDQSNAE